MATSESSVPYARNGIRDGNGSQAAAFAESPCPYARDRVGDANENKILAIIESTALYACNNKLFFLMCYLFGNIIRSFSVNFITFIPCYVQCGCSIVFIMICKKSAATFESTLPYARNGVRDSNRGKICAIFVSIIS